jgi:hypothetical protein
MFFHASAGKLPGWRRRWRIFGIKDFTVSGPWLPGRCRADGAGGRDRLPPIDAFAMVLLTLPGAAGESLGMDRLLKSKTSKFRTHSLFHQCCMFYEVIPTMPDTRLTLLMARFTEAVSQCASFYGILEVA